MPLDDKHPIQSLFMVVPTAAAQVLKEYVYALRDPEPPYAIRYIGRGSGTRATDHISKGSHNDDVDRWIQGLRESGTDPRVDFIVYGLPSQEMAQAIESCMIASLSGLFNKRPESQPVGLRGGTLLEVLRRHGLHHAEGFPLGSLLVGIDRTWDGHNRSMIYPCTRGWWKLDGKKVYQISTVFAVSHQVIVEVFDVNRDDTGRYHWQYDQDIPERHARHPGWVFTGTPSTDAGKRNLVGRSFNQLNAGGFRYPS